MSYLLPCRPLQQQITVLVAQRVVRPLQIIAVRHNKTRRKIAGLYHMIAFRFQIFHEKTLPTTFSASARSFRKSSSPLRRLFTLHPNTLSEQQIPGLRPFLHQTHLLPFSPDRFHRIPFPDIRIPPNQNPIHQIHHKHHTRTVNPIRRLPAPPVLASKIPLRTLHNLPPKLLFRPPLRNPLLHKKPLFRFSPQKPIRIQSFS